MKDLVIGLAVGYDWDKVEPFAVSLVRSGYYGDKVLFVKDISETARKNLAALGFKLIEVPTFEYSDPLLPTRKHFWYVARFLMIHDYLERHPNYRFVCCADVRDVVFQGNPSTWLERNIGEFKLVAASEHTLHKDQVGNFKWIMEGFKEVQNWMLSKTIYCSGFISGRADYIADLSLGIYLAARHLTETMWGVDQPVFNTIMHQKPYADVTRVPALGDHYCINLVNHSITSQGQKLLDRPSITPLDTYGEPMVRNISLMWNYGLPNLDRFMALHQYDRIPPLAAILRKEYCLANLDKAPLRFDLTGF